MAEKLEFQLQTLEDSVLDLKARMKEADLASKQQIAEGRAAQQATDTELLATQRELKVDLCFKLSPREAGQSTGIRHNSMSSKPDMPSLLALGLQQLNSLVQPLIS